MVHPPKDSRGDFPMSRLDRSAAKDNSATIASIVEGKGIPGDLPSPLRHIPYIIERCMCIYIYRYIHIQYITLHVLYRDIDIIYRICKIYIFIYN